MYCEEGDWVLARSRVLARDTVVKSDQESALRSIVEDVGRFLKSQIGVVDTSSSIRPSERARAMA